MPLACQADEVRAAVASLSLCSAQTVSTLQRLLSASPNKPLAADESQSKAAGARKAPVKSSRATANRTTTKAAGASTKSGRGAAPISIHTETQDALSPSQKQKLATDVVNSSLKVLTDAIKSQPKTHPRDLKAKIDLLSTSSNAHKPSLGRTPSTQSQESCKSPARPLTELRNSSNPLRRSSSNSSTTNLGPSPAIIAVAECSRIAFSYLRAIASRDTEAKGLPAIQVETGMLALVAKLILHGLDTLAFKELRILKRCLEKHECVETPKPISRGEVPESDKETLATLLRVECRSSSNAVLNLVVLHHTHVLRLLSKSKRVALIESAANYLDFASPFSPTAIILGCAEVSGDTTRAIKQLESLGRSILALAPSAASSADAMSINPKTCISPQIAFRLQTTALDIHKRWWQLANHSPNLEKELLEPTSRYLDAYRRHAMLDTAEKYCFARSKIMPLLSPAPPDSATILQGTSAFSIYRSLSTLAHSASITADAQNFAYLMEKACVNTYASGILGMSCTIRSIMLHIESQAQIHVVRDKLQYCNAFSIKDSNGHVDTLLVELAVLRKLVVKLLTQDQPSDAANADIDRKEMLCETILFCTQLLRALVLSDKHQKSANEKPLKFVDVFINSSLLACNVLLKLQKSPLEPICNGLEDCVSLAEATAGRTDTEPPFVKISNAYWLCYQTSRSPSQPPSHEALRCLKRSIEILQNRCFADQESGFLAVKLEKIASLSTTCEDSADAYESFKTALEAQLSSGILQKIARVSDTSPLHIASNCDTRSQTLIRILDGLRKTSPQHDEYDGFYDDANLCANERAILLELQISAFGQSISKRTIHGRARTSLYLLTTRLLDLYCQNEYPLRRARTFARILNSTKEHPGLFDSNLVRQALEYEPDIQSGSCDRGLQRFETYIVSSLKMAQLFHKSPVSRPGVISILEQWRSLVNDCPSWKCLEEMVDDMDGFAVQLRAVAAFLEVRGDIAQQTEALQLLANVYGLQPSTDPSLMLQLLAELGLQYLRIGHSGIADKALQQAEALAKHDDVSALARVQYWLAEVERNVTHRQLDRAQQSATMLSDALKSVKASDPARKSFLQQMRANAALVYSSLNAHLGEYREALLQAKRSVMFNRSAISILEQEFAPPTASPDSAVDIADIVQGVSELTFATKDRSLPSGHQKSQQEFGSMFWGVIPSSMRSYNHLSQMYAQTGLRFEAEYYAQEARKLAGIVKDAEAETRCATIQALHAAAIGEQYSRESAVIDEQFPIDPSLELVEFHTACGDLHARTDSWQAASEAYDTAESLAIRIASKTFNDKIHFLQQAPVDKVGSKFARSSTTGKTLPIKNQPAQRAMKSGKKIVATTRSTITATNKKLTTEDETIPISRLRSIVLRQRSLLLMRQGQLTAATDLLVKAESICPGADDSIMQQIAYARVTMSRAAQVASADFTFNVLPESTISYPSLSTKSRRKSHNEGPRASLLTPPRPSTNGRSTSPKKIGRRKAQSEDFAALLQDAQNRVARLQAGSGQVIGLSTCYQLCALASKASVLLSAIDTGLPRGTLHPTRAALSIELPRIEAVCREISSIGLDKSKDNNRDFVGPVHQANNASPPALSAVQFQRDFIDIIPESWTAVSLGLSEDCNELYVTRYQSRQAPFILRLPLVRNKLQDLDEDPADEFSFHAGKAELQEIVTLTNYSCHRTPDPSIKGAKTAWWAEREALDERLHELLLNIESLWLGGFKGIFSQHLRQSDLLARFRTTFESILDRNLPSRQGAKGRSKSLTLDSNVLELFIGLGDDQHGAIDIDEQILDLLYFVVDVLQFNGERNAYDEVDFDNIATETLDALRSYHEAAMPPTHEDSHLILVLDKRLHAFPWENLPCLSGVNVSRVGSMLSLRERIVAMRRKQCEESTDTFRTTKVSGTYIMNPSSDLVATQATLEPLLSSLQSRAPSGWNAISNKVPTEQDFTGALSESSMLLYFGHGSGNQYVRNRAIRKLDKCSDVVWLMGCSSGAVAENGDYEPTSVPLSYLMAGAQCERSPESDDKGTSMEIIESGRRGLCMAVVATLWDVTDKDIDRFSVRVGEEWGLWSNSAEANALGAGQNVPKTPAKRGRGAPKTPAKTPGRSRSRAANVSHPQGRKKSLVEAVAKGRGACNLRYLNGAATVVYGIPVYLDD